MRTKINNTRRQVSHKILRFKVRTALSVCSASLGLVALAGCEVTPAEKDALLNAFDAPTSGFNGAPPAVQPSCFGERFVQPDALISRSIDLLFVTDTSGSLDDERASIADGIDAFVNELPSEVDYRISTMLAHGSRSSHTGKLYRYGSNPTVLDSATMSLSTIRTDLKSTLTHTVSDTYSDGGEEGLYSLTRGLDADKLAASRTQGFFRTDAALAVVFISDENDICAQYPDGVTPVADPEGLEAPAKARDCAGITPASVLQKLQAVQGDRPLVIGGINYTDPVNYPHVGENEYGYGYLDLVRLAGGVAVDMATGHFADGLSQIGRLASIKLQVLSDFTLTRPEIDATSIHVTVDGQATTFEFNSGTNAVHIDSPGISRSVVDINYCLVPQTPPSEPCTGTGCSGGSGV